MKKYLLLGLLGLMTSGVYAQKAKPRKPAPKKKGSVTVKTVATQTALDAHPLQSGQSYAYDVVNGSLTKTDAEETVGTKKRYYDVYTLSLKEGEELRIEAASDRYRVALQLKTPDNQTIARADTAEFPGFSIQKLAYKVPATGIYSLRISTTDAGPTGDYLIRKYLLPGTLELPAATADACERLHFLLAHHQDHFLKLKGKKGKTDKKAGITEHYETPFAFVAGKPAEIIFETEQQKTKYLNVLGEFPTKDAALKAHAEYVAQLKKCLEGWQTDELSGEKFQEFSLSSYTDFITLTVKEVGKKKFQLVFGLD
ncbi:PPC domain-containing protein [Siphonobacter aquaeclarae]|uniref:Pre-peptidase C-terminal domain-containing protein n=1 Tax=Siphonobacter aquaeclarae TaxID=563176 RepID=A0A1G9MFA4_9BACT|nr:PPC domain-containing protein [Siphonobacter aquaeclarae]SDL72773.1 hypothetical protein SAMN04488090_1573 [Siphonobacter aquaeclarae]